MPAGVVMSEVFGRQTELAAVGAFLDGVAAGPAGLLLEGEAGIGKTTLWRAALEAARDRGFRVLATRPVEIETKLPFAGLVDLLEEIGDEVLVELPPPRRRALGAALLRADPADRPPDLLVVGLGFLGVLRALAREGPVLVALDDLAWLDASSARVLSFAVRRLRDEPVGLVAAARSRSAEAPLPDLVTAVLEPRLRRIELGPLPTKALGRLVRERLGRALPRTALLGVARVSGGNPFYALEIARALLRRDPSAGGPVLVPDSLGGLVRDRLAALPTVGTEVVLVAAAAAHPTTQLVERALGDRTRARTGLAAAVAAGVLEREVGASIRFTHPLLAAAVYEDASAERRRTVHERLAGILPDPEERARHLALATEGPNGRVAAALDDAARRARRRGAPDAAAELAAEALRLTPPDRPADAVRRAVETAEYHVQAGDPSRARHLLEPLAAGMPPGPDRAGVLALLGDIRSGDDWSAKVALLEQARAEAGDRLGLRAAIEVELAWAEYTVLGDVPRAVALARSALATAEALDEPEALARALSAVPIMEAFAGEPPRRDLLERAVALQPRLDLLRVFLRPAMNLATLQHMADELESARQRLRELREEALALGDWDSLPIVSMVLGWVETRIGDWPAAERFFDEAEEALLETGYPSGIALVSANRAALEARRGDSAATVAAAERSLAIARQIRMPINALFARSALGLLALSLGDHGEVRSQLAPVAELVRAAGLVDPAKTSFVADLVEAEVALGLLDDAEARLAPWEDAARRLGRRSATGAATRCRGLLLAARGELEAALGALDEALDWQAQVPEPLETARTRLVRGEILRRLRRRGEARDALESALETFESLGATQWAARTGSALARLGLRRSAAAELTASQLHVAELVAAGLTNREAADRLFLSVNTVETHLKNIYRTLGVRSRTELGRWWSVRSPETTGRTADESPGSGISPPHLLGQDR